MIFQIDPTATNDVTYYIPLAGIYQGKDNYAVYYMTNDGAVSPVSASDYDFLNVNGAVTTTESEYRTLKLTTSASGVFAIYYETPSTSTVAGTDIEATYTKSAIATTAMFTDTVKNASPTYTITANEGTTGTATINTTTGEVTVTAVGTYTVTATTAATVNDISTVYTATLTVTPKEVSVAGITAVAKKTDSESTTVELGTGGYLVGVEYGDDVSIDLTGATGTITDTTYWNNATLNLKGENYFDVDVIGLAITGADAGNYVLVNGVNDDQSEADDPTDDTSTTTVLIYQDLPYFSWPTAKEVVYGTARTSGTEEQDYADSDLYGGKVMVQQNEVSGSGDTATISETWVILEGHFEWVTAVTGDATWDSTNGKFTTDNAGTQSYYVKFVEDEPTTTKYAGITYGSVDLAKAAYDDATYRKAVDETTQLITQVVQKAQVEFTVDATTGAVTAKDIDNDDTIDTTLYKTIYTNQNNSDDTCTDGVPTAAGSYYVATELIANDNVNAYDYNYINYRHAGVSESTGKQIGGYYVDVTPDTYEVTFTVGTGEDTSLKITGAIWGDVHVAPTLEGDTYYAWYCEETEVTFEFGARLPQQKYDMTMTAVATPATDCTIKGTIKGTDLDGNTDKPLEYIAVTLMQGTELIDYTETDSDGKYSFTVAAGNYNLDVTRDQFDVQNEITRYVSVTSGNTVTEDFTIPDTTQNAELLVTTGSLDVVVQGLSTLTESIAEAKSATSTTIRLEISDDTDATYNVTPDDLAAIQAVAEPNGHTTDYLKLYMDIDLTQTIDGVSSALTELPKDDTGNQLTLTYYVPLAGTHQGWDNYYVYRYHDGTVDILYEKDSANADATEYIERIGTDMLAITAYKFSLYGVAYDMDPTYTPSPSKPSTSTTTTTEEETTTVGATLNREDHNAYMNGYPDDTFQPTGNITRAETTVMFSRLITEQMSVDEDYTNTFSDVGDELWYYDEIGFMEDFGIINGYTDGTFGGGKYITRAEFATIVCRFDDLSSDETSGFSDVDGHWASTYIAAAVEKGWITGYEDGTFRPDQYITRAEAVTLVNRMLERYCDEDFVDNNPDLIAHFTDLDSEYWAYYQIMEACHSHDYDKSEAGDSETWTEVLWHIQQ